MVNKSQDARRKEYRRAHYERFYCANCLWERATITKLNSDGSCPYQSDRDHRVFETADLPDARRDGAE